MSDGHSPAPAPRVWHAVDLIVCTDAEEAAQYALLEAGALGTETNITDERAYNADKLEPHCMHVSVSGYFEKQPDDETIRAELARAWKINNLSQPEKVGNRSRPNALYRWSHREVPARDWLAEWKKNWQPIEVGRRFVVAPPWSEVNGVPGRIVLRIEPGMAFGTGTHESTRLCLAAIEKHFDGGSFLDVGTGTGILAIAAAKLFHTARVEACDTDGDCITIAHENARLNGVAERINFRVGTVDEATASATLVCANLTADVIVPLLPALVGASCGRLILSGILETQIDGVVTRLGELGIDEYEVTSAGEWVALTI